MSLVSAPAATPNPMILSLLAPIEGKQPEGLFDEDNEIYLKLDDEMIKLGGLQNSTIDWDYVETNAKTYLSTQCKHLRVVGHLINCWLRKRTWAAWSNACELLAGFTDTYLESGYPKPGAKGVAHKRKLITTLTDRIKNTFEEIAGGKEQDKTALQAAAQALEHFQAVLAKQGFNTATQDTLASMLKKTAALISAPQPSANAPKASPNQQGGKTLSSEFFASSHSSGLLSASNERETRKTLLAIAEIANAQDAYDPVGYMIRRYALWAHITSTPIIKRDRITELMPIAAETAHSYQEAIDSNRIDPALLQRVEKSVTSSIYWFKGSYLAYTIATRLDMNEAAEAIRLATVRFIRRIPMLLELQFSDGQPFVDEQTHAWISAPAPTASAEPAAPAINADFAELQQQLSEQMNNEGVESVLQTLQQLQSGQQSVRQQCHIMKITADLMRERGLTWLSEELERRIENLMISTLASQWEPELYQQVLPQADNT